MNVADLPWRPSTMASRVFVKDIAVTDGWEMQAGRRIGPGWASVAGAGSIDEDVHSETGCVFVLIDRA